MAYSLLLKRQPALAQVLHAEGWGPYRMRPFGFRPPTFPTAPQRSGVYAAGGVGVLEFGSPLVAVVHGWAQALAGEKTLGWGGIPLHLDEVEVVEAPEFADGTCVMRTQMPVVLKAPGRAESPGRSSWLFPDEPGYVDQFARNLRRKAESLGLAPEVEVQEFIWVGSRRSFMVKGGRKFGAPLEVRLVGSPEVLRCVWAWGLGEGTASGFGWVMA